MAQDKPLFSASLVSSEVQLPEGYSFRPLQRSDYSADHLGPLGDLAYLGNITEESWIERFDYLASCPNTYYVLVIIKDDKIVGTGTLFVERKFLFKLGIQGHIEDVAISKHHQGKKLGVSLLKGLDHIAKEVGCYKTILDCSPENEGFYIKCDYEKAGSEMHHYYDPEAIEHEV